MLSDRGICVGMITHQEESHRVWCVSERGHEAEIKMRPWPTMGCRAMEENISLTEFK